MGKIVLLDDATINKIAAGEVIERPASVVKEIMENSIDAGATNISVEIRNGGISYIRVTDNGKGIMQDDMEIAFERHATSKLRNADDLNEIKSMGFRGEALASIAAIAKVQLVSKTAEAENGYMVTIEGGKILEKEETGCPNGTTITIENLFFNTPVRYKFLRKDFTESGYIEDAVAHIALIHPEIAIKLIDTGKTVIQTTGNGDIKSVIYGIYGKDIAENLIDINYQYEDILVTGIIGKPVISRSNRVNQLFFVNKRFVKDKTLSGAAEQAFKGYITIGKHGFLILNIEIDSKKVDVNVHPAKLEVRFQEENNVFKAVYHAIKDGLSKSDLVADSESIDNIDTEKLNNTIVPNEVKKEENTSFRDAISTNNNVKKEPDEEKFNEVVNKLLKIQNIIKMAKEENQSDMSEVNIKQDNDSTANNVITSDNNDIKEKDEEIKNVNTNIEENKNEEDIIIPENTENVTEEKNQVSYESKDNIKNEETNTETIQDKINKIEEMKKELEVKNEAEEKTESETEFLEMYNKMFKTEKKHNEEKQDYTEEDSFEPITEKDKINVFETSSKYSAKPDYKLIGIAFNTYIIIEIKDEIFIIDQHAAHERIMYEKVKKNYYSNGDSKDSQLMLLPDIITLTYKEMGIFRDNIEIFKKAGFIIDEFGENTVKLSGVPNILLDLDTKELFLETLDEINTVARTAKQEIEEKFIATVACKAAVKAHMELTNEEVEKLLNDLLILPNPFTCPHGRPTAIKMSKGELEKKFSRK